MSIIHGACLGLSLFAQVPCAAVPLTLCEASVGFGRAHLERPRGGGAAQWAGLPDADGLADGLEGESARDAGGRPMRFVRDGAGVPRMIRPEGWPGGFHRLCSGSAPGGGCGPFHPGQIVLDAVLYYFVGFPPAPAGVAFPESAGEILAEYGVPPTVEPAGAMRQSVYAQLHLPGPVTELPGPEDLLDLRLIVPLDLQLPDQAHHAAMQREYYLIRSRPADSLRDGPGALYLRLIASRREMSAWLSALGGVTLELTFAGTLLRVDLAGKWTVVPPA